jgi:hypothetical protein
MWSRSAWPWPVGASVVAQGRWLPQILRTDGFFLFGFEKTERANIADDELRVFQETAKNLLGFNHPEIAVAVSRGELLEICHDNQDT